MHIATDDLVVTRMSSICVMSLLQCMSIPVSDLVEKVVSIGIKEVSTKSQKVSDLFLFSFA